MNTKNFPQLETRHVIGIFQAAGDHYQSEIDRLETEVVRHKGFLNEPLVLISAAKAPSRLERITECQKYIDEYRKIVTFCREAKLAGVEKSAEEFAKQFRGVFSKE